MKKEQMHTGNVVYDPDDFKPYWVSDNMIKGSLSGSGFGKILQSRSLFVVLTTQTIAKVTQTIFNGLHITQNDF
jgi:hypothetical protein